MREIFPGIFVETDPTWRELYGATPTDDGVIIIDTPMVPRLATAFRDELRRVRAASPSCMSSIPIIIEATSWVTSSFCRRRLSRTMSRGSI